MSMCTFHIKPIGQTYQIYQNQNIMIYVLMINSIFYSVTYEIDDHNPWKIITFYLIHKVYWKLKLSLSYDFDGSQKYLKSTSNIITKKFLLTSTLSPTQSKANNIFNSENFIIFQIKKFNEHRKLFHPKFFKLLFIHSKQLSIIFYAIFSLLLFPFIGIISLPIDGG